MEVLTGDEVGAFIVDMDARYGVSPSDSPRLLDAFLKGFANE